MMRKIFSLLLVASISAAADIQLSPAGPISTPHAARDAARAAAKPVRIVVGEGLYPLTQAIELTGQAPLCADVA